MELNLRQVADIFSVRETKVLTWIKEDDLPAELVADQYRFHRAELLEWASIRQREFKSTIYSSNGGDLDPVADSFVVALERGGLLPDIGGSSLSEVIDAALVGLPVPATFGRDTLRELILSREEIGSTGIGNGIAVPHPRQPILLAVREPVVRLCYLRKPLQIPTPDGVAVNALFLMLCPTAHDHLQLLARLGTVVRDEAVRSQLAAKAGLAELLAAIRDVDRRSNEA